MSNIVYVERRRSLVSTKLHCLSEQGPEDDAARRHISYHTHQRKRALHERNKVLVVLLIEMSFHIEQQVHLEAEHRQRDDEQADKTKKLHYEVYSAFE